MCAELGRDVERTHGFVMRYWVIFREIVGKIMPTFAPVYVELCLAHSVVHPMEPHINCLGSF